MSLICKKRLAGGSSKRGHFYEMHGLIISLCAPEGVVTIQIDERQGSPLLVISIAQGHKLRCAYENIAGNSDDRGILFSPTVFKTLDA